MTRLLNSAAAFPFSTYAESAPAFRGGELHARLHYGRTDDIMRFGLHEYLMDFLQRVSALGSEVARRFLVPAV